MSFLVSTVAPRVRWRWWSRCALAWLVAGHVWGGGLGSRIKDLATLQGARDNQLVGVGLVTGIAGEGDRSPTYTIQALANLLQTYGMTVPSTTIFSKNVAVVTVTATMPPFAKTGEKLDVLVASVGDAQSLVGGVLLQTPLYAVDRKVYAAAQGPLSVGGFLAGQGGPGGATVQKNHPTTAQIIGGALLERELPMTVVNQGTITYLLRDTDYTTAVRMATAVNERFPGSAYAKDPNSICIKLPEGLEQSPMEFIARVETVEVVPDIAARIIMNERTGTIVATSRVKVSRCAIAQGDLTITIASSLDVSQPAPMSQTGQTVVTPRTDTGVTEHKASLITLPDMPTVEKVAEDLNALGVTPRDMMSIFEAMKQAGALQAELVLR